MILFAQLDFSFLFLAGKQQYVYNHHQQQHFNNEKSSLPAMCLIIQSVANSGHVHFQSKANTPSTKHKNSLSLGLFSLKNKHHPLIMIPNFTIFIDLYVCLFNDDMHFKNSEKEEDFLYKKRLTVSFLMAIFS